jgi:large subunit ribosomal protein L5
MNTKGITGLKEKQSKAFEALKGPLKLTNVMQTPKLVKVVVSAGIGSIKDKKKVELVGKRLTSITGQKVGLKGAKKSIAAFKVREGDPVGYQVTLRGQRMISFLNKLLNVSLPRTRDFRGISKRAIDAIGNITIGIRENSIFPETVDEELKDIFGLAITVVTTAPNKEQALAFFEYLGFPFSKVEVEKKQKKTKKEKKVAGA